MSVNPSDILRVIRLNLDDAANELCDEIILEIIDPESRDPLTIQQLEVIIAGLASNHAPMTYWQEFIKSRKHEEAAANKSAAIKDLADAVRGLAPHSLTPAEPAMERSTDSHPAETQPSTQETAPSAPETISAQEPTPLSPREKYAQWRDKNAVDLYNWMTTRKCYVINEFDYLALTGNIEMLECAVELKFNRGKDILAETAAAGQMEAFNWMVTHGCVNDYTNCVRLCAKYGQLASLRYIWKTETTNVRVHELCEIAAAEGHLYIVSWCSHRCSISASTISKIAADGGHHHIVDWINAVY